MYEDEQIIEEVELTTEGEIREYVAENEDRALYVPILPGLADMWFFDAEGHLTIVKNDFGDFALAEPRGDDVSITDDDTPATAFAIDVADGPLTEEGIEEVTETLTDHHGE